MPTISSLRRVPLLPLGGFFLVLLAMLAAFWINRAEADASRKVSHAVRVKVSIAEVRGEISNFESALRGYVVGGEPIFLDDMDSARRRLTAHVLTLRRYTFDNASQQARVDRLVPLLAVKVRLAEQRAALIRAGHVAEGKSLGGRLIGRRQMLAIRAVTAQMLAEEDRLIAERQARARRLTSSLGFGLAAAVLLVVLAAAVTLRDARRRHALTLTARDVAEDALARLSEASAAREAAEEKLRQVQKMEAVGQLTGGIAHDFNNMLAIVIGSLDLAARRMDDRDRLTRAIGNAREGAERAAALTSRLLAFSRQSPLAPSAVDANRLVSGMSDLLCRTIGEQIAVETVLAGGLWPTFADPGEIENAILNLAVNARDAMADRPAAKLTIETANTHFDDRAASERVDVTPGQYVMICVSDTGCGMPADVVARAFDPFFTTKAVGRGTGLGLSQVFGFAKQSRGHVAIYSEPGHGTTVKLYLPRYAGVAVPAASGPAPETAEVPSGRAEEIILVVEDEQRVRHFSVDALRELGYTALSANDGEDALRILSETPAVSMLFTDVVMPGISGRELADRARAIRPDLRILYTTGYTRNAIVHNGVLDPGVALLPKPFTIRQLAAKIRAVLDDDSASRAA